MTKQLYAMRGNIGLKLDVGGLGICGVGVALVLPWRHLSLCSPRATCSFGSLLFFGHFVFVLVVELVVLLFSSSDVSMF